MSSLRWPTPSSACVESEGTIESLLRRSDGTTISELLRRTAPTWYGQLSAANELPSDDAGGLGGDRLKRELALFLEEVSRDRPLVLFLEDLHWADVSTIDVLTYVADRFDRIRILVLVTYRSEDMRVNDHAFLRVKPTLEQRGLLSEIGLGFLRLEDVKQYLALAYPGHAFTDELPRAIHKRTEGNPFFMVSLLRQLSDQQVLTQEDGRWTLARRIEEVQRGLPVTLASTIDRKMAWLDTMDRQLLGLCAVRGVQFETAIVAEPLALDVALVEERLMKLDRDHGLVERLDDVVLRDGPLSTRYQFVHVLYQHAFFESVGATRKTAWSRLVAEALIRHYGVDNLAVAAQVGMFFEAARDFERATAQLLLAAQNSLRVSAAREAIALSRRGLALLTDVREGPERDRIELSLLTTLAVH